MESEGIELTFDTRGVLSQIELEQLTCDEILEVKNYIGVKTAYVQLKKLVLDPKFCTIYIYRLIFIKPGEIGHLANTNIENMGSHSGLNSIGEEDSQDSQNSLALGGGQMSMAGSSMSSSSSNGFAFNGIIKDFKKALGERKTPGNLIILNRIMILILLATIALTSTVFVIETQ